MGNDDISLSDLLGPWIQPDWDSGMIEQCRQVWTKPLRELSNGELAMLIRQQFAPEHLVPIGWERIRRAIDDDSELFEGELQSALYSAANAAQRRA